MHCSCDTVVCMPDATASGCVLFAKTTDRHRNEALGTVAVLPAVHPAESVVMCTRRHVPQVRSTAGLLMCQPAWMWGCEMGANEYGVVAGNEALFTCLPPSTAADSLTGMDILRLALERARTAEEAKDVVCSLVATYGQGGNCGFGRHEEYYNNAFLLADASAAWHVESCGRVWAARRVMGGIYSISNVMRIGADFDATNDEELVRAGGSFRECVLRTPIELAPAPAVLCYYSARNSRGVSSLPSIAPHCSKYSDSLKSRLGCGFNRRCRVAALLEQRRLRHGRLTPHDVMAALADHGLRRPRGAALPPQAALSQGWAGVDVCMHAGPGPVRLFQSTGSLVSVLPLLGGAALAGEAGRDGHLSSRPPCPMTLRPTHWVTGTSAPCLSLFKPLFFDPESRTVPDLGALVGPLPGLTFHRDLGASLWWRHELVHRALLRDYGEWAPGLHAAIAQLQPALLALAEAAAALPDPAVELQAISRLAFRVDDLLRSRMYQAMQVSSARAPGVVAVASKSPGAATSATCAVAVSDLLELLAAHRGIVRGASFQRRRTSSTCSLESVGGLAADAASADGDEATTAAADGWTLLPSQLPEQPVAIHAVLTSPPSTPVATVPPPCEDCNQPDAVTDAAAASASRNTVPVPGPATAAGCCPPAARSDAAPEATHARWVAAVEWLLLRLPLSEPAYFASWDAADAAAGLPVAHPAALRYGGPIMPPTRADHAAEDLRCVCAAAAVAVGTLLGAVLSARLIPV
jgi:secernin